MTESDNAPLPEAVLRRHALLLDALVEAQRDRVRRRRSRRAYAAALALLVIAAMTLRSGPPVDRANSDIVAVVDRPSTISIVEAAPLPITLEYLTDDQAIDELRAAGMEVGIARTADEVMIVGR